MTIPIDVIDPTQQHHAWLHEHEWHLDLIPPIIDAIVTMTLPHIRATPTDKIRVTGGGYIDNITLTQLRTTDDGRLTDAGPAADATHLWSLLAEYVDAVQAWTEPTTPAPALTPTPDADPLTARAHALTAIGWLITHANQTAAIHELDDYRADMFRTIRSLRGRYGVHPTPRRPRARCTTCGLLAVTVTWTDNPNGGAKPVRVVKCQKCHQIYTEREAA